MAPTARAAMMAKSTYMFSWAAFSYVTARQSQTDSPLQARAGTASTWEQFYIYYSGDSWVIQSTYNAKFVSARLSQTDAPLQARADTVGAWEKFELWLTGDGATVIQSKANGKYVTARASQTDAPLQARAAVIDDWEKFTIPL
ncbi:fascin domain-containing protein [Micromonospora zamorensis]|uniref:fascin domain-containing protein n=1 Tax=Micromonospora zamorensis TaxID=709883 RepID=UPI0033BA2864